VTWAASNPPLAALFGRIEHKWALILSVHVLVILGLLWLLVRRGRKNDELKAQLELLSHRRKIVFDFLHDLGEAFTEGIDLDELLRIIARFSVHTTQASAGAVFLLDKRTSTLRAAVVIGPFPPPIRSPEVLESKLASRARHLEQIIKAQTVPLGQGLIGEVARSGKPLLIQNGLEDPRIIQYEEPSLQTRTAIIMPLKFRQEVLGVMAVVNKESGESSGPFNANDLFLLDSLADHAAVSLHNTQLYTLQAEKQQLDADLRVASEIQRMLLPVRAPLLKNFQLAGANQPARQVGGDYYDFLPLSDSCLGIVIADVSGKAVPGALVMATCRSVIRAEARIDRSPQEVLRRVNQLVKSDLREDMFVTIIYGILDAERRTFTFARAGHDPVLWHHAASASVEVMAPKGVAVGLAQTERFNHCLEQRELACEPGDVLLLYTDGLTESLNPGGKEFGRDQLIDTLRTCAASSAEEISRAIFDRVHRFTGEGPAHDDQTLIVARAA
jgi:sigma-B regulation protein RsbU (phosphoserine phosphatase)